MAVFRVYLNKRISERGTAMGAIQTMEPAFYFSGGAHGVLLLHGFTQTPETLRYQGDRLRAAGYTVYAPMLPGHGQSIEAMARTGWRDWLDASREYYTQLSKHCARVTVAGLSMGGVLACLLAEDYPVSGLVCLSPALKVRAHGLQLARLAAPFYPVRRWREEDSDTAYDALELAQGGYEGMPTRCLYDLQKLADLARRDLFSIVAPTLIIQPIQDESVHPSGARLICEGIASKEKKLLWLERSRHLCAIGPERGQVAAMILEHLCLIDDTDSLAL